MITIIIIVLLRSRIIIAVLGCWACHLWRNDPLEKWHADGFLWEWVLPWKSQGPWISSGPQWLAAGFPDNFCKELHLHPAWPAPAAKYTALTVPHSCPMGRKTQEAGGPSAGLEPSLPQQVSWPPACLHAGWWGALEIRNISALLTLALWVSPQSPLLNPDLVMV